MYHRRWPNVSRKPIGQRVPLADPPAGLVVVAGEALLMAIVKAW